MNHKQLGLELGCGTEAVKTAWRALASKHHPDRGGDPQTFSNYRLAYTSVLAEEQALESKCQPCNGKGHVLVGSGFAKLKMACSICGGLGIK